MSTLMLACASAAKIRAAAPVKPVISSISPTSGPAAGGTVAPALPEPTKSRGSDDTAETVAARRREMTMTSRFPGPTTQEPHPTRSGDH